MYLVIAGTPDFTLAPAQSSQTIAPTGVAGYSISVNTRAGFNGSVGLSASGLPTGAAASFSPASVTGAGSSVLTVTTTSATPLGTYPSAISGRVLSEEGRALAATVTLSFAEARGYPAPP